ncbi:MAG TPA: hypothetical protein VG204_16930 [Terriglobia bacterium]|nr:hypothetical protein [Terriglobia bacterium]
MLGERLTATLIDHVSNFVYHTYILPALARGDSQVSIQVVEVWLALDRAYSMNSIRDVLRSAKFQEAYNLSLTPPLLDPGLSAKFSYKLGAPDRHQELY